MRSGSPRISRWKDESGETFTYLKQLAQFDENSICAVQELVTGWKDDPENLTCCLKQVAQLNDNNSANSSSPTSST